MSTLKIFLYSHPRLAFKNSEKAVQDFISARLAYFKVEGEFFADQPTALAALAKTGAKYKHCVLASCMNPWLDMDLVQAAAARLEEHPASRAVPSGHIPGTQFDFVVTGAQAAQKPESLPALSVQTDLQARWNNQLNLFKYKRLKMFLGLIRVLPKAHTLSIPQLMEKLASPEWSAKLLTYFESGKKKDYSACPHCEGPLMPLPPANSQPMIGYIPGSVAVYHQCVDCGLGLQSPTLTSADLPKLYDEFDSQDFAASHTNPEAFTPHKVRTDFRHIQKSLPAKAAALDLGGGMGHFSRYLKQTNPGWTVIHSDFESKKNEQLEKAGIKTKKVNFVSDEIGEAEYDLITAWEVLEHLAYEDFASVVAKIHRALKPGGFFVFSTPDFDSPICRAFDFYNVAVPFHPLLLSQSWLKKFVEEKTDFSIHSSRHCSDFVDDWQMWSQYLLQTSPGIQSKAMVQILDSLFRSPFGEKAKDHLLAAGIGTEVIFTLRKS